MKSYATFDFLADRSYWHGCRLSVCLSVRLQRTYPG